MRLPSLPNTIIAASLAFAFQCTATAQQQNGSVEELTRAVTELRARIDQQQRLIEALTREAEGRAATSQPVPAAPGLDVQRGTGSHIAAITAAGMAGAELDVSEPDKAAEAVKPVGQAPKQDGRPPEIAPPFEQPGILTQKGKYVLEPSLQFGYSSSNRVALVGYTVIPALLIGLIDVREVKRNTFTGALAARTGLTNRFEVEMKVPYVYRSDATVSRELFTGTAVERVFNTSGMGLGDVEFAGRYQLNQGGPDKPYYIAGLRVKSRTGTDPFSVVTDCTTRCVGENVTGTGLPLKLPTGSGFYSLQPTLTWLFPSDPAIFFGTLSYLHSIKRNDVSRRVLNGESENIGDLAPGDVFGFNFGLGLALNDKASVSLGYDHSSIGRMKQNGSNVPGSVRTQLGTLLVAYSYRLSDKRSLNVSVGAGVTRDTPDVSLSLRVPTTF